MVDLTGPGALNEVADSKARIAMPTAVVLAVPEVPVAAADSVPRQNRLPPNKSA
jgi:hypothetical protein